MGKIAGTDMHVVTFLFVVVELLMFTSQTILFLSRPKDSDRKYYMILLGLLIIKNIASGLFPDPGFTTIPLAVQYGLAYGAGFVMASYFPFYFYRVFELNGLRWHALYGVPLLILVPFFLFFLSETIITGNIESSINHGLILPAIYGLVLLFIILNEIRKKYLGQVKSKNYFEAIAVYAAITPWAFLAFCAFYRIEQVKEVFLTNAGFIVITVLFIGKGVKRDRDSHLRLQELSKREFFDSNQVFEQNLTNYNLTAKEREIVNHIREGKTYKAIADELHRSERTVTTHAANIFFKVGVSNKVELLTKLETADIKEEKVPN
ncbi:LuxR family transcriptional regulator [Dyadobacter flavalbus]|uniref:LuxR family transcriptional regulator n=1 Tax=Dyadobacter flavalbus TaxID=2579942 RepID=A0A5M8QTP0_9BACT|nr:LuxR family transcriptional regulator [Dyadobacter flavalbus]KAA6437986.1 LuxR family transcriptional regulator [Dyadobacter flavalbus]